MTPRRHFGQGKCCGKRDAVHNPGALSVAGELRLPLHAQPGDKRRYQHAPEQQRLAADGLGRGLRQCLGSETVQVLPGRFLRIKGHVSLLRFAG
jgi:hypothetical protein